MGPAGEYTAKYLTASEKRILKKTANYKRTLAKGCILLAAIVYIWIRHYSLFAQNAFFLVYNIIIYLGILGAALDTFLTEKRSHSLFNKLIDKINGER